MKKITKIAAALTALVLTFGVAGCGKKTTYPDYYNPEQSDRPVESGEKYVINVQSEGGMPLDGVRVSAKKDGAVVRRGISQEGKIELAVSLGEYDLEIDETSLPAGYYVDGTSYKTNASSREEVTIKIPSKVVSTTDTASTAYALGYIARDFTFTDCYGGTHTVSSLLESKKAVVLNFWYSGCGPCRAEFPAIEQAYKARNDIEILAICSTHQGDTNEIVSDFKSTYGLSFPMGVDTLGLTSAFGVSAFPTTYVIDRYGLIAYRSTGNETASRFWTNLFNDFTSDSYRQSLSVDNTSTETGDDTPADRVLPNVDMPASSALEAAANAGSISATYREYEDSYSWPWLAGDGYIYSSNTGVDNSYSIVYVDIDMKKDQVLSFEYNVSSEAGCDVLYALIDGDPYDSQGWSATDGWQSVDVYIADRDKKITLAFAYQKDERDPDGELVGDDVAKIRNIHLKDISAIEKTIDVKRACASGYTEGATRYDNYVTPVLGDDGYYHVGSKNGPLISISINSTLAPWIQLHMSENTTTEDGNSYSNTLYYLTYWKYASGEGNSFNVKIKGTDITDTVLTYWSIQGYMEAPSYLIPVNEELKEWAELFVAAQQEAQGREANDKEWLEFCYYYSHYDGNTVTEHDDYCRATTDVTRGLRMENCYFAYEKNDPELANSETYNAATGRNVAKINYGLALSNGSYYKFTAKQTGVYQFRSYLTGCSFAKPASVSGDTSSLTPSPNINIYSENGSNLHTTSFVLDHDQYTLPAAENYEGFNTYYVLEAGQTVYLQPITKEDETGYYDFEITYLGTYLAKMMDASLGGGMWTYYENADGSMGEIYYDAINAARGEDGYYYKADANDNALTDQPIYIDMIHMSYIQTALPSDPTANYKSPQWILENIDLTRYFRDGAEMTATLERYLAASTANKDEDDEYYGLVAADQTIVDCLNKIISFRDDSKDARNGWLGFACYVEKYGA